LRDEAKVRFPRGLIGTADSYRALAPGYIGPGTSSSCAYGFMHLDVMWWLVSRTDLASVGRQMTLKSAIVSLGTILEAVLKIPGLPKNKWLSDRSSAGVKPRIDDVAGRILSTRSKKPHARNGAFESSCRPAVSVAIGGLKEQCLYSKAVFETSPLQRIDDPRRHFLEADLARRIGAVQAARPAVRYRKRNDRETVKPRSRLRNEEEVRSFFINPIVEVLGYDKGTDFSVDLGKSIAYLDKNKFPDYKFNLWQENFWLIEAKRPSPGRTKFGYDDLAQAVEYAIHPDINAALVVLCDGSLTEIFDREVSLTEPVLRVEQRDLVRDFDKLRVLLEPIHTAMRVVA
jgi:hypothetical protein